jgi:hypothetical protein
LEENAGDRFIVSEYIEFIDHIDRCDLMSLSKVRGFQKLAYLLL